MKKATIWTNSDGLAVGFGTRDSETTGSAKVVTAGKRQEIVMRLKLSELGDAIDANDLINAPVIPAGSVILSANLRVIDAATGTNAVLDIGIAKASDGTDLNDDGIDAAIATATLVNAYYVACDGAEIGAEMAYDTKLYASYDTAAFTGGVVEVTVTYIAPGT